MAGRVASNQWLASGESRRVVERAVCGPADYVGVAWYRTRFAVPASKVPQRVLLRFGAVDYPADVFVQRRGRGQPRGRLHAVHARCTLAASSPGPTSWSSASIDPPAAGSGRDPRLPAVQLQRAAPEASRTGRSRTAGCGSPCGSMCAPCSTSTRCASRRRCLAPSTSTPTSSAPCRNAVLQLKVDVRDVQGAVVASLPVATSGRALEWSA